MKILGMESRARASGEQFSTLLEFMESHGDLSKPQPGAQGRLRADRLWQELANTLNSIGSGVNKTPDKWKKVWADWKSKTKKKGLTIRRHASGTGGGPNSQLKLTDLETRVLAVIGALAVEGHPEIEEQGFDRQLTAQSQNANDIDIVIEDGLVSIPSASSPLPSTSRQQQPTQTPTLDSPPPTSSRRRLPTPTPTRSSPPRPATLPAPSTPPPPLTPISPQSSFASPRRRRLGARRRRTLTPFDRAVSEFVAVERHRLQLEEKRERNEARRIEVDHNRNNILSRFTDIVDAFLQQYLQSRQNTE